MLKLIITLFFFLFSLVAFADNTPSQNTSSNANNESAVRKEPLQGTVALTFDDGPSAVYTPQILAILKRYNIKATFFVVGANAQKHPELIQAIHDEGHVIASHSMTHPMLTKLSEAQLQKEISLPSEIVDGIIHIKPKCLRYPFGASNERVRNEIRKYGMTPAPMGFNSYDYKQPGTQKIIDRVLKNSYSKQVIIMHDGYDKREQTVAALPVIIEGIKKKGLGFSTICG